MPARATALAGLMTLCLLAAACSTAQARTLAQSDLNSQCRAAFEAAGGESAIAQRVPSCSASGFDFTKCCDEAKAALATGPSGCLCDPTTWAEVERLMSSAGIPNLNANTLGAFTSACGIATASNGRC